MDSGNEIAVVEQEEVVSVPAVIVDEGQKAGSENLEVQDIFGQLIMQSNFAAHEAEAKLQVEEKGNNVADLQGFCAGIRSFKSKVKEVGFDIQPALFDTANRMTPWIQEIDNSESGENKECDLDLDALTEFSRQLDELSYGENYSNLEKSMQEEIKKKKDYLYGEAKNGRDLFWVRGWDRGFNWVKSQIKELHYWKSVKEQQAERRRKEKASELPFEDED